MLSLEELVNELGGEVNELGFPPGFRFHPTDEELITFYLASKVFNGTFSGLYIAELDLNRCEPWDLPEMAKMGEREWYFFSVRDRKYPTGLRTNRATSLGYWKATGKDKAVYSSSSNSRSLLGMKKTLVFYKGRAPRGDKTKWVMHEYRLAGDFSYRQAYQEDWVICRIYNKTRENKADIVGQEKSYLLLEAAAAAASSTATTTLLEEQKIQQQHDLQNLLAPDQRPFATTINNLPPASMLVNYSLLPHQQTSGSIDQTQYKTEAAFSCFQQCHRLLTDDVIHHPLSFDMNSHLPSQAAATAAASALYDDMMLDSCFKLPPGELWPSTH